jgi:N4-gp56 family major capsid protein
MANELFATAGLTVEARNWYEKQLLMRVRPRFVYNKYTRKKNIPRHGGNNIQFRRFEAIAGTTTALTEGTPPTETQATFSEVILTINQYGQFARLSDFAIAQSQDDLTREYSENFGEAAGDSIDQLARTQFIAGTSVQYASTATTRQTVGSGMYLTAAEIREAVRTLKRNDAKPIPGSGFVGVIHPDSWFDLMGDSDIVSAYENAGPRGESNPLFTGELFRWMGVTFEVTTNAAVVAALSGRGSPGLSGAAIYQTVVFGEQAVGASEFDALALAMVVKPLGSSGAVDDPLDQLASVGWKGSYAAGILNENFLTRIEHLTTTSRNGAE